MVSYQEDQAYQEGVPALYQKMLDWNEAHMGKLTLSDTTLAWMEQFGFLEG